MLTRGWKAESRRQEGRSCAFPACPALSCLVVSSSRTAGALNVKVMSFVSFAADRHALRHRAELLVPRLDRVGARRQALEIELAVLVGHREERMIEDADIRVHPAVHVALERHHHFLRREGVLRLHALDRLAVVELGVGLRQRVDVVQGRIAVDDFERLADAHAEHVRMVAAFCWSIFADSVGTSNE